jgi:hypothetical protein
VQGAVQGEPLDAGLITDYRSVAPFLAFKLTSSRDLFTATIVNPNDCVVVPLAEPEPDRRDFDGYACLNGGVAKFRAELAEYMNFMVYRQSRINSGPASDWVQVSPLIDYVHFDREFIPGSVRGDDRGATVWTLNDPYIKTVLQGPELAAWFVDQYPFLVAADATGTQPFEWRYQVVYFDSEHRPVRWRGSDWFAADD